MSTLRRLKPLILPKGKEKRNPGPAPSPILLKTSQLRINDEYQRSLSKDSSRMATKIAVEYDWELYHLLVVSPIGENDEVTGLPLYEILDGQHTAIGAISNGNISELWCWPGRVDETLESRAGSFRKLNTQRTSVTPVQLFWASVTEKNEDALDVIEACDRTGATIVKRNKPYGNMRVGETLCTGPLVKLAHAGGVPRVERVLRIGIELRLAPISDIWIRAIDELLFKPESSLHLEGIPSTVDLKIVTAVGRIGVENMVTTATIAHTQANAKDGRPSYWFLAAAIKKEMDRASG